jgi:hypothetical protein
MAYTFTETTGIIQGVIDYMDNADNKAALTAKNFDVTPHIARLTTELGDIGKANAEQEKIKADLKDKTIEVEGKTETGYKDASGLIDAMGGLLGKGTPAAQNLQTIRSKVRQAGGATTPTPPVPKP